MSTDSISKDFSIRSQKMADSLLDALVRSGKKSKQVSQDSKNKTTEMRRVNKLKKCLGKVDLDVDLDSLRGRDDPR